MAKTKTTTKKTTAKAKTKTKKIVAPKIKADPKARSVAHGRIKALVAKETARRLCICGCKTVTARAFFVPGHDAKLLSTLLKAA